MKFLAIAAFLAATTFGMPVVEEPETYVSPSGLKVRGLGNQGDGFYLAVFDKDDVATIEFTPFSALDNVAFPEITNHTSPAGELVARGELNKRGSTCSGPSGWGPDMDAANIQLAHNGHGKWYNQNAWGWVHHKSATSFFCNYRAQPLVYDLLIRFQTWVSYDCGGSHKYGYHRCRNACGINDLAVGRTWRGDHFCDKGFKG